MSGGRTLTNYNEINCLEYSTLKIPYELMNKKFRAIQRLIDQSDFHFNREIEQLELKFKARQAIPITQIAESLQKLNKLTNQFKAEIEKQMQEEIDACEHLNKKVYLLSQANNEDNTARKYFYDERINRFIIEHLLRTGYFESAQMLADYIGLDIHSQKNVYHIARQVEESLKNKDLTICLIWVRDNRSRLHRIGSSLETEVRVQQCIELIKEGRNTEALIYIKTFFGNKSDLYGAQWSANSNLLHLMGLIALGKNSTRIEHQPLLSDSRYNHLIELFREENERIYKLCPQSAFSACLQAGIAVHKTPQCKKDETSDCVVCKSVYELSDGLPYTHLSNSRLFCSQSKEPFDTEENRPMMLPNGRVYSEKWIQKNARNNQIKCPISNEVYGLDDLQRVYVF